MCGIVGATGPNRYKDVHKMMTKVSHRGPDGAGVYNNERIAVGHTRLAVIDPEGGAQPMHDSENDTHIVFNGEIYNYRLLRKRFKASTFKTRSDTETLLRLENSDQDRCEWLRELEGMFAFAIIHDDKLVMARDPLGIKPLYVGKDAKTGHLVFASEIRPILEVTDRVREFPPGHLYVSGEGLKPYFSLEDIEPDVDHAETACRGILRRLVRSVRASLTADTPVGVFLSGGLDSSLLAALAKRFVASLDSFAVGMEGSPDLERARCVSRILGTRHHEFIFTLEEALSILPDIIRHLESFDSAQVRAAIPNYFLARLASKRVKVALSGEGADELFAGYEYLKQFEGEALQKELLSITRALHNTNLQRCDRMSMAHGLEVRVPYLDDTELVEYAFRISTDLKMRGPQRIDKWILRKTASSLLPQEVVLRKKARYDEGTGLRSHLIEFIEKQISDAAFEKEREITPKTTLRSKEELFYYRIFREQFPAEKMLPLIGRSRVA